ncbi:MAG: polysulfide reductase NrfD [Chloroflexi bacterium]|nr:polysulfide reductase NrfD [Chloroflexota bacterium]
MAWGFPIAMYLFLAGMGAGAYLTAIAAQIYNRIAFHPLIRAGMILSGVLVGLGMPFLIADLGAGRTQPWRLIWLFSNPTSPMSWGVWVLTPFIPLALLQGWLEVDILNPPWPLVQWLRKLVVRWRTRMQQICTLLAIVISIYTGLLLGVVHGVPLWNTSILPMLFFVSALSTGLAACVVLSQITAERAEHDGVHLAKSYFYVNQIHSALIVTEVIFIFCWLFIVANGSVTAAASVGLLLTGKYSPFFWIGIVFFGVIDPLLIYIYEVVLGRPLKPHWVLISDSSVILGGLVLRYLVIAAAVPIILT